MVAQPAHPRMSSRLDKTVSHRGALSLCGWRTGGGKELWTGLEGNWLSLVLGQSATTSWEKVSMNMGLCSPLPASVMPLLAKTN